MVNFICILGYNVESTQINVKNLTQFEFSKTLLKIRETYCNNDYIKDIFTNTIDDFDLSKKRYKNNN